jgi:acetyl-CoA synthetase
MIGLRELARSDVESWDDAGRPFAWPAVERYNIAADCLRGDPDAPALLVVGDGTVSPISVGELDALSAGLAADLLARGLEPGDRVAVKLSQSVEMAASILAVLRAGGVVVPISNVLGDDGVRPRLADSGARLLVALGSEQEAALARDAGIPLVVPALDGGGSAGFADTTPDTPALLLYTSGTTGKPKGVLHGHRVILGHRTLDYAFDRFRSDDVAYSPVDWAWAGGLFLGLLVPLAQSIPVVTFRERKFDPERLLSVLRDCRVTIGLFPPTSLRLLRQSGAVTPEIAAGLSLRCLVTGAEAVEPELFAWAADELGVVVNNAYGMTEGNALIGHSSRLGTLDPVCLGRPYPGRRIALLDDAGQPVAAGEPGEISLDARDPVCMLGYWNDPEATGRRIVDGWLRTGDTAHTDEEGNFHFHGRSDDIIKSGAYRIGPAEVEAVILQHAAVAECAVVGLPDPVRGQVVTAAVRLREGHAGSDELTAAFQGEVRRKVGAHAYPRDIRYVETVPRTTTGKVNRAALREQLA